MEARLAEQAFAGGKTRQVRKKGAARRQQIIDVARQVLIQAGVSGLVLREIAERVGITHGNLQYYFATKEDLIVAIFDQEVRRYTTSMHDAVERTTSKQGRISAIIDAAVSEIRSESTALWMMLFSLARQNQSLCVILRDTNRLYDQSLAEELARVEPTLSYQRRFHIAQMIRMMLDGLGVQAAYDDPNSSEMIALQGEIKAAVSSWFGVPEASQHPANRSSIPPTAKTAAA